MARLVVIVAIASLPLSASGGKALEKWKSVKTHVGAGVKGAFVTAPVKAWRAMRANPKATIAMAGGLTLLTAAGHYAKVDLTMPMLVANVTAFGLQARRLVPQILRARGTARSELVGELGAWTAFSTATALFGLSHPHDHATMASGGMTGHEGHVHMHGAEGGGMGGGAGAGLVVHAGHFAATASQLIAAIKGKSAAPTPAPHEH